MRDKEENKFITDMVFIIEAVLTNIENTKFQVQLLPC